MVYDIAHLLSSDKMFSTLIRGSVLSYVLSTQFVSRFIFENCCALLRTAQVIERMSLLLRTPIRSLEPQPVTVDSNPFLDSHAVIWCHSPFLRVQVTFCPFFGEPCPFLCVFAPFIGSDVVKVRQRFACHVWHFDVFCSHCCTCMSWRHHGIHQMHVLSHLGDHFSVHAMQCNIHRLVHYVFWALSCDVLTRVSEF